MERSRPVSTEPSTATESAYPENPVLCRVLRGGVVESQHRGAWVLVDPEGEAIDGAGAWDRPIFARSSVKSFQALPLLETGAAERYGLSEEEIALALASHNGEVCHSRTVRGLLERLGLRVEDLQCGAHRPTDPEANYQLRSGGAEPSALHNNCSGKHAGFLALSLHIGAAPAKYLDPGGEVQQLVLRAVREITSSREEELTIAVDGCSAPTFRMPLRRLATGICRVANPEGLAPERREACERMTAAAARHPVLIAGSRKRLCTDILRATGGRVFPKLGGEAAYVLGIRGARRGIAIKVDDGSYRGFNALVIDLLRRHDFITQGETEQLSSWRSDPLRNWAGLDVGRVEVVA